MDKTVLYRFFSNKASFDEEKQLLAWLEEDLEHQKVMLKERYIFDTLIMHADKLQGEENIEHTENKKPKYKIWLREFIKIAAIILIVISAGFFYVKEQESRLTSMTNTISVPAGQRITITLPDGTKVCMNACSSLQYPSVFAHDQRRVLLKGDAYFEVTHNSEQPFVVETSKYNVEVLGTTFYIESDSVTDYFTASLIEGKVKVINNQNPDEQIILKPDEQASVANGKLKVQPIPDYNVFLWRNGLFCFQDMSFDNMLKQIEKYYDVTIVSTLNHSPEKTLSGKIKISDGIEHALRVLQKNIQFKYTKEDNTIYIN